MRRSIAAATALGVIASLPAAAPASAGGGHGDPPGDASD
ncbi:hypothetical protein J2S42_003951 [Catenuloplanes indicus]|uniref:Uncharacterized protein n=1 Tax=Catenuloplanes indicus TaxID=137267 RepID=A0AAE3W1N4_9ACTN|nr:hypothetical protein [Catenuloplanes indicus]